MSASRNNPLILLPLLAFLALPGAKAWAEAAETVSENKETDVIIPDAVRDTGGILGARRDIGGVQTMELAPVSQDTAGTLDADKGGLPVDMWKATPRELIETYLPQLSPAPGARAAYDLQRRLLLTSAEVPSGLPGLGEKETAALLIRRVERLYAMGDWDEARKLLELVPERLRAESLIRYDVEALFQAHEDKQACERAEPLFATGDDRFWSKAAVVCALIEDDKPRAGMALDMLREEKISDPFFVALAESMLGVKIKKFPAVEDATTLQLVLLRLSKKPLPDGLGDKIQSPPLLKAIALWPEFQADIRLAAALKAEAATAFPADQMAALFDAIAFSDKELAGNPAEIKKLKGLKLAALHYRLAKKQEEAQARAQAIAKGIGLAPSGRGLLAALRLYAPLAADLPPGADLAWFAPTAIRALLAAGQNDKAKAWIAFAKPQGEGKVQNKSGEALLLPILRLMDNVPPLEEAHLKNWQEAMGKDASADKQALLLGLFEALGDTVPVQLLTGEGKAKTEPANIQPGVWNGLRNAAEQKSVGQAVLFSLLSLGEGGGASANAIILQETVRTLRASGLVADARWLALEGAIAAGI